MAAPVGIQATVNKTKTWYLWFQKWVQLKTEEYETLHD